MQMFQDTLKLLSPFECLLILNIHQFVKIQFDGMSPEEAKMYMPFPQSLTNYAELPLSKIQTRVC